MTAGQVIETDVVIVGSGTVGVTAASEAREAGASVVVLEKVDRYWRMECRATYNIVHKLEPIPRLLQEVKKCRLDGE